MTPEEKKARELGKHIFDWGASMQGDNHTIEKYRAERDKAINQVAVALKEAYNEGLERAKKVTCKYCDMERPLIGDVHVWQILICKDKKGKLIYNPVQEDCLATAIRKEKR